MLFLLGLVASSVSQAVVHQCGHKATWYPQNTFPILDGNSAMKLINTTKNGKAYEVHVPQNGSSSSSSFVVVHVWGSAYEKGEAQGQLMQARVMPFLTAAWNYLETQIEQGIHSFVSLPLWLEKLIADVGLDVALDATEWASKAYSGSYFYDELKGLCSAVNDANCYRLAVRIHMLAGLTQGHCSLFGAWGASTANGHTLQLRALDWNMDGPFRDYPSMTIYHANDVNENSFVTVGMVGFIGGLTGMSDKALGISEIGVSYPDDSFGQESRIGVPFIFLLRDILQFDQTVDDAINRMANSKRTCDLILGVGDGNLGEVRGFQYSDSVLNVFDDRNMRPTNSTWHFHIQQMIYWGMDWLCPGYSEVIGVQLKANWGSLTIEQAARDVISVAGSGDVHIAIYDLTTASMLVSFASPHNVSGPAQAFARQFTGFNVTALFNEQHP